MNPIVLRKDLRGQFGPARDQGARPTCLAFAASDAHAAARGPWAALSCEFLFYHAKRRDGTPPVSGARLSSMRDALEFDGQPSETDWAYSDALPIDLAGYRPPAGIGEVFRRGSHDGGGSFDEAWSAVMADTPPVVGMTISDAFFEPNESGVVDSPEAIDPARRHAVVAAAAGESNGTRFLLVRSSWGESWGLAGYAWLAESYAAPRVLSVITLH